MKREAEFIEELRTAKWHTLMRCIPSQPVPVYDGFMAALRELRPQLRLLARLTPNGVGYPMVCFEPGERGPKVVFAVLSPQLSLGPGELSRDEVDGLDATTRTESGRADVEQTLKVAQSIIARSKKGDFAREDLIAQGQTPEQCRRLLKILALASGPRDTLVLGGRRIHFGGETCLPDAFVDREPVWKTGCRVVPIDRSGNWSVEANDPCFADPSSSEMVAKASNEVAAERLRLAWALKVSVRLYVRFAEDLGSGRLSMLVESVEFPGRIEAAVNQALLRAQLPLFNVGPTVEESGSLPFEADVPFSA
jgi:hypothetical protein